MNTAQEKQELRQSILAQLRAIPAEQRNTRSAALRFRLRGILSASGPLNVAIYAALPHEVDLLPLLAEYPQHRYAFPRCGKAGKMQFHHVTDCATQLRPGAMGIPTPQPELPVIPAPELHVIIVPGVAFTRAGARLGYGGGYYDRYLPLCPDAIKVATIFPEQLVCHIPTEAHDLLISRLITI